MDEVVSTAWVWGMVVAMGFQLLDEIIQTDYGQFDIVWGGGFGFDGEFRQFFAGQSNGLVGAADANGVYLHFGRRSGGSSVRIELLTQQPPAPVAPWEDVVEVSVHVTEHAEPHWSSWAGESGGPLLLPPDTYRVRVSARGRDAGQDGEFAEDVVDFYLVEFWRAPFQPDSILSVGSANAEYWHREIGGRR